MSIQFRGLQRILSLLSVAKRAREWRAYVLTSIAEVRDSQLRIDSQTEELARYTADLTSRLDGLMQTHAERIQHLQTDGTKLQIAQDSLLRILMRKFPPQSILFPVRKGARLLLLPTAVDLPAGIVAFAPTRAELLAWAADDTVEWELALRWGAFYDADAGDAWPVGIADSLRKLLHGEGADANAPIWRHILTSNEALNAPSPWPLGFRPEQADPDVRRRRLMIALGAHDPALVPPMHALESEGEPQEHFPPFGEDPVLALGRSVSTLPAEPQKRSVLFVNPAYYNFKFLSAALRARGWDAVSMAIIDPSGNYAKQFHGHDWNLFVADPNQQLALLREKFKEIIDRFGMFHFIGVGGMAFFPYNYDTTVESDRVPWDVLEMKRRGAIIGYTISGCHDLINQTSFGQWSPTSCPSCSWRDVPSVCSDERMSGWGWKVRQLADLVSIEADVLADYRVATEVFREPLTMAVDPEFWNPQLARTIPVPDQWKEPRADGEVLIYHSVGNYDARTKEGVNMKGTRAVLRAIEQLKNEGHRVRLLFRRDVPSIDNRWMLAQADIVVDQLNYGRYGATGREGLMLGRPVVGRLNKEEPGGVAPVQAIAECPIVDASEDTVYSVLKRLVVNPTERERLGLESRAYAVRWWSKEVLAERFERVHDHIRAHGRPPRTLD
jgi:hypothetical protein